MWLKRTWLVGIGVALVAGLVALLSTMLPPPIDAYTLVQQGSTGINFEIDADHVTYTRAKIYRRANPALQEELADPYHSPVLAIATDTFLSETWARGGNMAQTRGVFQDYETERLVSLMLQDGNRVFLFHETNGHALLLTSTNSSEAGNPSQPSQELPLIDRVAQEPEAGFELEGEVISSWGKPAWVVRRQAGPPPTEHSATGVLYPSQGPYTADLDLLGTEARWTIDQASKLFVSTETWALTPTGRILLSRTEIAPLEVLPLSSLPETWLDPPDDIPVVDVTSQAMTTLVTAQVSGANAR